MLSMVVAMSELRVLMSLSNILGSFMLEGGDRTTHRRAAWMHRAKGTATIRASRQPGGAAASAAACLHRIEVQDVAVGILQPDPLRAAGDMDVAFEAPEPAPARGRRRRASGQGRATRRWRGNLIHTLGKGQV